MRGMGVFQAQGRGFEYREGGKDVVGMKGPGRSAAGLPGPTSNISLFFSRSQDFSSSPGNVCLLPFNYQAFDEELHHTVPVDPCMAPIRTDLKLEVLAGSLEGGDEL